MMGVFCWLICGSSLRRLGRLYSLLGSICPALEMVNFNGYPHCQVLFSVMLFLYLEVVDQFLPLPLPNLGQAGSLRGFTSLCTIMGFFPHELFCLQSKCWFTALSFPGLALAVVAFCSVHCCQ
jgi:hypothetical protein